MDNTQIPQQDIERVANVARALSVTEAQRGAEAMVRLFERSEARFASALENLGRIAERRTAGVVLLDQSHTEGEF